MDKERFNAFKYIIDDVCFKIKNDLVVRNMNYGLLLAAYNLYIEDENGGNGYIFNLSLTKDLKDIVNNDLLTLAAISRIGLLEEKTIRITDASDGWQVMKKEDIIPLIVDALPKIVACAIMYAHRNIDEHNPYKQLLEEYFVTKYEEYIKKV